MPSRAKKTRTLCMIGDSQIGSVSLALREGLTSVPDGYEMEFWGVEGPAFRTIDWTDGAIRPAPAALERVLTINGNGRDHIAPGQFDGVIFYGARLRVSMFFAEYFQWASDRVTRPSRSVLETAVHDFAISTRAYRFGRSLAAAGDHVFYVPAPFNTDGVRDLAAPGNLYHACPAAFAATEEDRAQLWDAFEAVAARDGITLLRQPEDTVTTGILTKAEFCCDGAVEQDDIGHKSPAFAARWLKELWPVVETHMAAA
ncbi:hypothetical protein [uncultured Tateyamaria sp.]|uniref:hypothetical protein n=1 Tax=Tateyamaria sp. 1078 TaxID=3417464 RepID=UPI0026248F21|nr:hypothetical protein [uncultured Tateyamaria sp.]